MYVCCHNHCHTSELMSIMLQFNFPQKCGNVWNSVGLCSHVFQDPLFQLSGSFRSLESYLVEHDSDLHFPERPSLSINICDDIEGIGEGQILKMRRNRGQHGGRCPKLGPFKMWCANWFFFNIYIFCLHFCCLRVRSLDCGTASFHRPYGL
jgi:hypothetical protein